MVRSIYPLRTRVYKNVKLIHLNLVWNRGDRTNIVYKNDKFIQFYILINYNKNMNKSQLTVSDVSKKLGVPKYTITNLCSRGLVPRVKRSNGSRVLEPWQVDLIAVLLGMKQAGFRPKEIRQYSRLFRQGKQTEKERLVMLTTRKRQLWHEIEARQKAIDFIERQEETAQSDRSVDEAENDA